MEKNTYSMFNISDEIIKLSSEVENEINEQVKKIDEVALFNQAKVLKAFNEAKLSQMHFGKTTGYGYDDIGRETIEKIYAKIFKAEDALVRIGFVNGTHTLATALRACLMPNDRLLAISGKPYDTLCEVIGINQNPLSLISYGVKYSQIDLDDRGNIKIDEVCEFLKSNDVKMIHIQRSKGYAIRKSIEIDDIKKAIFKIREIKKDIIIMVDNCYGEFVEEKEPVEVGADLVCGSLIKNIGGGLCEIGGYIVGKQKYIKLCSEILTCPGIGKECGATLGQNKNILQGLFMAPSTVKNAMKSAIFASRIFEKMGYEVYPKYSEKRSDIVQAIKFGNEKDLVAFIQKIQELSPVDSHVVPYPWEMPGYSNKVIMAAGTFVEGASIELSADSPIREPYVAYMQGALTYESAKLAICYAASSIEKGE